MSTFTERFNELPNLLGFRSMSQLARDTGFTPSSITSIARGETKPRFEVIHAIAVAYPNLNLRWLITGTHEPLLPEENTRTDEELEDIIQEIRTDISRIKQRLSKLDNE